MFDKKTKSYLIAGVVFVYYLILYIRQPASSAYVASSGIGMALLVYFLYQPAYILLTYQNIKLYNKKIWKQLIASVLLILSFDFVAMPFFLKSDSLSTGTAAVTNIGGIVMTNLDKILPHTISHLMVYLILPSFFTILAITLLGGTKKFSNNLENGGGLN